MGSLLDKFTDPAFSASSRHLPCVLDNAPGKQDKTGTGAVGIGCPCEECLGGGVRYVREGVFARASLCSCVRHCPACLGTCLREVPPETPGLVTAATGTSLAKTSRPCRRPLPPQIVTLFNQAQIPARFSQATLEAYSNFSGNGAPVVRKVRDYLSGFKDSGQKGLLLSGPVGIGKTFLLIGMARKLIERGFSVKYVDYFQLLHELRATYSPSVDRHESDLVEPFSKVDVLFVDEFAKSRGSDWELTVLDQLVMARYNSGKALIAATNYRLSRSKLPGAGRLEPLDKSPGTGKAANQFSPDSFELIEQKVGQRIFSRLREMTKFVEIEGHDYRPIFQ